MKLTEKQVTTLTSKLTKYNKTYKRLATETPVATLKQVNTFLSAKGSSPKWLEKKLG